MISKKKHSTGGMIRIGWMILLILLTIVTFVSAEGNSAKGEGNTATVYAASASYADSVPKKLNAPSVTMPATARAGEPITIHIQNTNQTRTDYRYSLEIYDEGTGQYRNLSSWNIIYSYSDSFDYTLHEYGLDAGKYRYRFNARWNGYEESEAIEWVLTVTGKRPEKPALQLSTNSIYEGEAITITIQGNRKLEAVKYLNAYPEQLYAAFNGRVIITTRDLYYRKDVSFRAKVDGCWTEEFRSEEISILEDESASLSEIAVDIDGVTAYAGKDFTFPVGIDPRTEFFTAGIVFCEMDETGYDHDLCEIAYEMILKVSNGMATIPGEAIRIPGTYRINFSAYAENYGFGCYSDGHFLEVIDNAPSSTTVTVSAGDISNVQLGEKLQVTITAPGANTAALKVTEMEEEGETHYYEISDFHGRITVTDGKANLALSFDHPAIYYVSAIACVNGHWTRWSEPLILRLDDLEENEDEEGLPVHITSVPKTVIAGEPFTVSWDPIEGADEYEVGYFYSKEINDVITVPAAQTSVTFTINLTEEDKLLLGLQGENIYAGFYVQTVVNGKKYYSETESFELIDAISPMLTAEKTLAVEGEEIQFTVSGMKANDLRIRINGINQGQMSFQTVENTGTIHMTVPSEGDYTIQVAVRYRIHSYSDSLWSGWSTPVTVHVSPEGAKEGLVNENGMWVLYKDGEPDTTTFGIVPFNGGRFFVANGAIIPNSGLVSDNTNWYFLSSGQVADYTGLAEYDGAWFYVTDGILDTNRNGIVSYDGGQFMLAAGRIVTEANGLIQDPNTGIWYFVSAGQVASGYRGLALYDGHWFYVWDGVFQDTAEGWVEYDGSVFYVVNGMVV